MAFFVIWIWLSVVTRLAVDRISLSGLVPYWVTSSRPFGVIISIASGFYTLTGVWEGLMLNWTLIYVILWLLDSRSPADVWRLEQERQQ